MPQKYRKLPGPADDDELMPFWRRPREVEVQLSIEELEGEDFSCHFPSIFIQGLCGYNYSEANYREQATRLESYGFECFRSRRGDDGKFREIWLLSCLSYAQGELYDHMRRLRFSGQEAPMKEQVKQAVSFLCQTVEFGSLSVAVQKAALTAE